MEEKETYQNPSSKNKHRTRERKRENVKCERIIKTVKESFFMTRDVTPEEVKMIKQWMVYRFPLTVIREACDRTWYNTQNASFAYASAILRDWHKKGVRNRMDIEALDEVFHHQNM